ncbi:MAG: 50S ribosomal protein L11 methyltransferase [Paracoccaceae bacterium]
MNTFTALTTLRDKPKAEALALALENLSPEPMGVGVFEVEDGSNTWEVGGYFTTEPDTVALALLAAMNGAKPFAISRLEDRDWVAHVRRELTPVYAGRFVVFGAHDRDIIPSNLIKLQIEAAMAFGTGHHATTQGCLLSLDKLVTQGVVARNVADIGSGTGVLAMAAASIWPCATLASDIDQIATATAKVNIAANGLKNRISCHTSVGFRHVEIRNAVPFDLVFANILAGPLKRLAPDMAKFTTPGSILILSGILTSQALSVEATYKGWGFHRLERRVIGEWTTLTLGRG